MNDKLHRYDAEFIPYFKLTNEEFLKVDCSMDALNKELIQTFGYNGKELQKKYEVLFHKNTNDPEGFNIWVAYDYLKKYTGINGTWFDQEEYEKRISNIQDILNV